MTEPDTTALRRAHYDYDSDGHCDDCGERYPCTVRALCDGYDEAQDYRARWIAASDALAAARQANVDLIGELRGLAGHGRISGALLNDVVDPYDPDLFHCVHCEQYRDVNDGTNSVAGMGCHDCAGRP